jgi:hypothetical protein
MHAARFFRDWFGEAEAGTQAHSDLPGPSDASKGRRFRLTCIGQAVTMPAGKEAAAIIQESDPAITTTTKPRTAPA